MNWYWIGTGFSPVPIGSLPPFSFLSGQMIRGKLIPTETRIATTAVKFPLEAFSPHRVV